MIRFTRRLSHKITNSGAAYTMSIPREIAEALGLKDGGLVSLGIWAHRNEVLVENYEDSPHPVREVFDPSVLDFVDVEVKPSTKGPSRSFGEYRHVDFKVDLRELRAAIRWVTASKPRRRR